VHFLEPLCFIEDIPYLMECADSAEDLDFYRPGAGLAAAVKIDK
jgi:hypothetical protein